MIKNRVWYRNQWLQENTMAYNLYQEKKMQELDQLLKMQEQARRELHKHYNTK